MRKPHGTQCRIKGGEQKVFGHDARVGEPVEQRRLPSVRVSDQRHNGPRYGLSPRSTQTACALHLFEITFDPTDTLLDQASICFDLCLAWPTQKAEAATLALQMCPGPHEARFLVREVRQFDLQRALPRPRAAPENLQYKPGAIDDFRLQRLFEIALLHRRQRTIGDNQTDLMLGDQRRDLLDLAFAEKGRRTDRVEHHDRVANDIDFDRGGETDRLFDPCLGGTR